jgi:hypothetical protein
MPNSPRHVCLQKTIKEGLRRCVYRRWEAEVKGSVLITKTIELERMYRGNTPYPVRPGTIRRFSTATRSAALAKMARLTALRLNSGFQKIVNVRP